jgi:hypothetical protein
MNVMKDNGGSIDMINKDKNKQCKGSSPIFRIRPKVELSAILWDGDNLEDVIAFTGWHPSASERWTWEEYRNIVVNDGFKLFGVNGPIMVPVNTFIIAGHAGFFTVTIQEFFKNYIPVSIN